MPVLKRILKVNGGICKSCSSYYGPCMHRLNACLGNKSGETFYPLTIFASIALVWPSMKPIYLLSGKLLAF